MKRLPPGMRARIFRILNNPTPIKFITKRMTISGFATAEGTKRYQQRFAGAAEDHFREEQGLTLSSIGIGTYLGDPEHKPIMITPQPWLKRLSAELM